MIEARADVTVPVEPAQAFVVLSDLETADWLPAVRGLRHVGGPKKGKGARYEVEAGLVGRHLQGVMVCLESVKPERLVLQLEEGLDLTITALVAPVRGGCTVTLVAQYHVTGALGGAVERASAGAARREVGRAVENFAARFGRKQSPTTTKRASA